MGAEQWAGDNDDGGRKTGVVIIGASIIVLSLFTNFFVICVITCKSVRDEIIKLQA